MIRGMHAWDRRSGGRRLECRTIHHCPLGIDPDRYSHIGFSIDRCQYVCVDVKMDGMENVGSSRPAGPLPIVQDTEACSPSILAAPLAELEAGGRPPALAAPAGPARPRPLRPVAAPPP